MSRVPVAHAADWPMPPPRQPQPLAKGSYDLRAAQAQQPDEPKRRLRGVSHGGREVSRHSATVGEASEWGDGSSSGSTPVAIQQSNHTEEETPPSVDETLSDSMDASEDAPSDSEVTASTLKAISAQAPSDLPAPRGEMWWAGERALISWKLAATATRLRVPSAVETTAPAGGAEASSAEEAEWHDGVHGSGRESQAHAASSRDRMVQLARAALANGTAPIVAIAAGWRERGGMGAAAPVLGAGLAEGSLGAVYEVEYGGVLPPR